MKQILKNEKFILKGETFYFDTQEGQTIFYNGDNHIISTLNFEIKKIDGVSDVFSDGQSYFLYSLKNVSEDFKTYTYYSILFNQDNFTGGEETEIFNKPCEKIGLSQSGGAIVCQKEKEEENNKQEKDIQFFKDLEIQQFQSQEEFQNYVGTKLNEFTTFFYVGMFLIIVILTFNFIKSFIGK